MQNAELYIRSNHMQFKEAKTFLDMCSSGGHITFKDRERILDVGCGPGNITVDLLLPLTPPQAQLVGIDISHTVLAHASSYFSSDRVSFRQANIEDPCFNVKIASKFDKIFSFHCINWVKNQRQTFANMNNLLKAGGSLFIVFVARSKLDDVNSCLLKHPKWKHHLKVLHDYNPKVNVEGNMEDYFYRLLKDNNLNVTECKLIESTYTFQNLQHIIDQVKSLIPTVNEMSEKDRKHFCEDVENIILSGNMAKVDEITGEATTTYDLFRIIAHKPL